MRMQRAVAAGALATGGVLAAASAAWACTAWTAMYPLSQPAGAPGSTVKVSGTTPSADLVQIRWDGLQGPVLATAQPAGRDQAGAFSATVKIPKAAPGVHYVVVDAGEKGWSRAAFRIPGKAPATSPDTLTNPVNNDATSSNASLWRTDDAMAPRPSNPAVGVGIGLLAVGGVTTVAGFGLLGIRRTRAKATRTTD